MHSGLRTVSWSLLAVMLVGSGQMACTHGDNSGSMDKSDVSVTDDTQTSPSSSVTPPSTTTTRAEARIESATEEAASKTKKAVKRTEAAAARNAAKVGTPGEGSEEEYAADVDAAMGDASSPDMETNADADAGTAVAASAAVNSEPDNSKVNRLSDGDIGITADQQGNSAADVEMTRKIRRSIIANKELSTYAHNVKIITRDGQVVLKGPVRSEIERKTIEDVAVTVAGAQNVTSGLEVANK